MNDKSLDHVLDNSENRSRAVRLLSEIKAQRAKHQWRIVQIAHNTWKEVRV